ncbi:MAG: hypothetical protein ABIQ93_14475 [Saprospiraceae bacterium]
MFRLKLLTLYPAFLFVFFHFSFSATGQPAAASSSIFDQLTRQEGVKMTLEMDVTTLVENKKTNTYFPAMLTTEDGTSYKIEVKPRGKYRRKISEIPPMKLKFKKKLLVAAGLDTLNEVKLVLPTIDNAQGDELLVKEYLIYRMFERITSASVHARLIKLTIRDTHVEQSKRVMLAMLIEDEEETVARLHGKLVEQYGLPADSLLMDQAGLVAMFEYMVGNTDWEISMMRNVRLIQAESGKVCVVPYDFDFSGLVSAPYASPSSESGLRTVRDRFLMANGISAESLKKAVQVLRSAKKDLYDLCRTKHLSKVAASDMIAYLETFYTAVELKDEVPITLRMPTD